MIYEDKDPLFNVSRPKFYYEIIPKSGVLIVDKSDIPIETNSILNRFVICRKYPGTATERLKARWIIHVPNYKYRFNISNNSPMLIRMNFRIIISLSVNIFK